MQFPSDNAASVHPAVWRAMQAADGPDVPYDGDGLSRWLDGGLWLANARAANAAATEIAGAAGERLLHPVEANELFVRLTPAERAALRAQGFAFYDWDHGAARFVTAWNSDPAHGTALVRATAGL